MDVVQIIYRPMAPQGSAKDHEFSRATMSGRWQQGLEDARVTLQGAPWLAPAPHEIGLRTFDVIHDLLVAKLAADNGAPPCDPSPRNAAATPAPVNAAVEYAAKP